MKGVLSGQRSSSSAPPALLLLLLSRTVARRALRYACHLRRRRWCAVALPMASCQLSYLHQCRAERTAGGTEYWFYALPDEKCLRGCSI
jgi:hypothetical protein